MQVQHYHKSKPITIKTQSPKYIPKIIFTPPEKKDLNYYFRNYLNSGDLPSPNDSDDDNNDDNDDNDENEIIIINN